MVGNIKEEKTRRHNRVKDRYSLVFLSIIGQIKERLEGRFKKKTYHKILLREVC